MMKLRTLMAGALMAAGATLAPAAASALTTFSAYDDGASTAAAAVNSNAAQAQFSAAAGPTNLITFESAPLGDADGLAVGPGATLGADGQTITNTLLGPPALFGFNITSGGSRWASLEGGTLTFNFATPITSFGAYLTGVQLADAIEVNGSSVVSVANPVPTDGGVAFLGFTSGAPVSQVVINAQPSYGDVIGVDNVQYTAWTDPVPEPATWAIVLLGVGAIGSALRRAPRATRLALFHAAD